jgi:hypothetical protein
MFFIRNLIFFFIIIRAFFRGSFFFFFFVFFFFFFLFFTNLLWTELTPNEINNARFQEYELLGTCFIHLATIFPLPSPREVGIKDRLRLSNESTLF